MPSLRELQTGFAEAMFSDTPPSPGFLASCAGPRAEVGLAAYRRGVRANLAGAVRASYPVIERIVGTAFLDAAIRRYVPDHPSTRGDLNAYGHDFDAFLATFEPAAGLPYLADVARMEWLVQSVHGAADAPDQDLSLLFGSTPEQWGELHFTLDPAHAILKSPWPLAHIWEVNQPNYEGCFVVDFDEAQTVLIHRRPAGMAVEALVPGEAEFLSALSGDAPLETAVAHAASQPGFDLSATLQRFIGNGLLRRAFLP
jgi:hypothetical protein